MAVVVLVLMVLVASAFPDRMRATNASERQARIAFTSDRNVYHAVYVVNAADGSGLRRLTQSSADSRSPHWSPDGERIAFARYFPGGVYVMNADGSGQRNLTGDQGGGDPAWSPDGQRIAFVSKRDGNGEVYVMNADGSGQRNLTRGPEEDRFPDWSPGGRKIAFTRGGPLLERDVYVMNTMRARRCWGRRSAACVRHFR